MAVYNCEQFLRETLDSVVDQEIQEITETDSEGNGVQIPFERIVQVIMVDDGSTDGSGKICDEYAEKYPNFQVVHKQNGGVSSARNEGLKYVEGKYMNFLDSDDKISDNVLCEMFRFFEQHYDETDVVTIPIFFFDAKKGAHWQNYKFSKNARIAELFNEYDCPLMFVNASFFKSEYKDKVTFDSHLVCGEDIKYISMILSEKMTMGLVPYCHYDYRRRSSGEESLVQSSNKKIGWYTDYFTYLVDWVVEFCQNKWGYIPFYFQNILVSDLKWRFFNQYDTNAFSLLGESGVEEYKRVLSESLKHFDDQIILSQRSIWNEHKAMMLCYKYGRLPEKCVYPDDIRLRYGNTLFCWLSSCYTKIDFISITGNTLRIEGFTKVLGFAPDEELEVALRITNNDEYMYIPCKIIVERDTNEYRLGDVLFRGISFVGEVTLENDEERAEIAIALIWNGHLVVKKNIRFGTFSPVGTEYNTAFYCKDGYMVTKKDNLICFEKCGRKKQAKHEKKFLHTLRSGKPSDRKAYYALTAVKLFKKFKRKPVWLISDREKTADDNGEALFTYLRSLKKSGLDVYFVIHKDSPDRERLSRIGNVVDYFSHRHKMLYLLADVVISSAGEHTAIFPFKRFYDPYRRIISSKKFVFLQHGIIKDDLSGWLNRYNKNISGFVTSAVDEYNSIVNGRYFYDEEKVWLTGLPRYDFLYHDEEKIITIMPTWRAYLDSGENVFMSSDFFRFYTKLFTDQRLIQAAQKLGYRLWVKPHPRMTKYLDLFKTDPSVRILDTDVKYRYIFAKSSMVVTDYSSVAFDFAYLEKPVMYTQFDKDAFFGGGHMYTKGYFDYERDGLGEVAYDLDTTVELIIAYMESGCELKPVYRERIERFYAYHDKNNCERVYKKILRLTGAKEQEST